MNHTAPDPRLPARDTLLTKETVRRIPIVGVSLGLLLTACGSVPVDDFTDDVAQEAIDPIPASNSADSALSPNNDMIRRDAVVMARQVPIRGRSIASWTTSWYRWHFAVPADKSPILHLDQDCATDQDDRVFFVPTYDGATSFERSCRIPYGKPVLVPVWVAVNDYPCPDPAFRPAPGQSMEDFLREGAVSYNSGVTDLAATVDGAPVALGDHRHTSRLFHFSADPSLVGKIPDPCLVGGRSQPAVADGWWLMLVLVHGEHVVQITGTSPEGAAFATTYRLNVDPR